MWTLLNALGPWLVGLVLFGGPVLLAFWLSHDSTRAVDTQALDVDCYPRSLSRDHLNGTVDPDTLETAYRLALNPQTGVWGLAAFHRQTGMQQTWPL